MYLEDNIYSTKTNLVRWSSWHCLHGMVKVPFLKLAFLLNSLLPVIFLFISVTLSLSVHGCINEQAYRAQAPQGERTVGPECLLECHSTPLKDMNTVIIPECKQINKKSKRLPNTHKKKVKRDEEKQMINNQRLNKITKIDPRNQQKETLSTWKYRGLLCVSVCPRSHNPSLVLCNSMNMGVCCLISRLIFAPVWKAETESEFVHFPWKIKKKQQTQNCSLSYFHLLWTSPRQFL